MPLVQGTRLGSFEVVALIGQGGMGEVYRATDTSLKRDVALKVLPSAVSSDRDRLNRFQREAEVLAALNHPNVAAIYGIERSAGPTALVMELVEGATLADLIARGRLRIADAVGIARQIAEALAAAHEQAIVHRDLKPANVKIRPDGMVKVLDFGLARALDPVTPGSTTAATITSPALTQFGVILGTAAYMAPEQARGRAIDKRADIWAFGCVMYEMLTGRRAFDGEDVTETLANVLKAEPNWSALPADTPVPLTRLLKRCLEKDYRRRLTDMADVRLDLEEATQTPAPESVVERQTRRRATIVPWAIAGAALLLALIVGAGAVMSRAEHVSSAVVRFDVFPPSGHSIEIGQPLSPDGRLLAYVASSEGKSLVWLRPLDASDARPLVGTEGATRIFWSPSSDYIAFFVDGNLKKVAVTGGRPVQLATGPFRDGAWSSDGVILVGGQRGQPLFLVSDAGGQPVAQTTLDTSAGELSHDYPEFIPGTRHYFYLARAERNPTEWVTYVGTLGSAERRPVPNLPAAGVRYSPSGHLLYVRGTTLMARRFDIARLSPAGEEVPVAEDVAATRVPGFSISATGTLAYPRTTNLEYQPTWFDRTGRQLGTVGSPGVYRNLALSIDGQRIAFERGSPLDLWQLDVRRGAVIRLTTNPAVDLLPVWSPDGARIAFRSVRDGVPGIYTRVVGAAGGDDLFWHAAEEAGPSDWSRDGAYILATINRDVLALPVAGGSAVRVTDTPTFSESGAVFSPDRQWIAYNSDESTGISRSGEGDVFVQAFPSSVHRKQVSAGGGLRPRWSRDGTELFFLATDGTVMAVPVTRRGSTIGFGDAAPLFRVNLGPVQNARYGVTDDGRFLMNVRLGDPPIAVVLNWFEALERIAPAR